MHSGSNNLSLKHPAVSLSIGIASLVLEGRLIASEDDDDENFKSMQDFHGALGGSLASTGKPSLDAVVSENVTVAPRHHGILKDVTERISVKLQQLRQCPGTSKEIIETTIAVPTNARGDENRGSESGVHMRTNENRFRRLGSVQVYSSVAASSAASSSASSSAKSIMHEIDADWNDTTVLYNGLEKINITSSPIKLVSPHTLRSSAVVAGIQDRLKLTKKKLEKTASNGISSTPIGPKQGPHCTQFLKNIGIIKVDPLEDGDHLCNHISSHCRRWQFSLRRLGNILMKGEDSCIEVYLGPEKNAILLEQWTFNLTNKPSQSTMTIQSLCSAIRSQLYFSQISSWMELLKNTSRSNGGVSEEGAMKRKPFLFTRDIMENPRLKKNLETMQVHLDIFFLIKAFDGQANFNDKPNVHQFPDTKVGDNLAIRVCLKSLPRLEKIPTLNTNKANLNGFCCDNRIKTAIPQRCGASPTSASSPTSGGLLNDRMNYASCHEKGKHRCINDEDEDVELLGSENCSSISSSSSVSLSEPTPSESSTDSQETHLSAAAISHREKQLLKYKKRLMKREKKKKSESDASGSEQDKSTKEKSLLSNLSYSSYSSPLSINVTQSPLYATSPPISITPPQPIAIKPTTTTPPMSPKMEANDNNLNGNGVGKGMGTSTSTVTSTNTETETKSKPTTKNTATITSKPTTKTATTNNNLTINRTQLLSIATQTDDDDLLIFNNHINQQKSMSLLIDANKYCDKCGDMMQCWNCDKTKLNNNNNNLKNSSNNSNQMCSSSKLSQSCCASGTMIGNKGDLLLQAIQRTGKAHSIEDLATTKNVDKNFNNSSNKSIISDTLKCERSECDNSKDNNNTNNYSDLSVLNNVSSNVVDVDANDCRLCKRQKTKHNYIDNLATPTTSHHSLATTTCSYRRTMSECLVGVNDVSQVKQFMLNETPQHSPNRKSMDANAINGDDLKCGELKKYRRAFSEDMINVDGAEEDTIVFDSDEGSDDDCIVIKCNCQNSLKRPQNGELEEYKTTPVAHLQKLDQPLYINTPSYISTSSMVSPHKKHIMANKTSNKLLPKINLAKVFNQQQFRGNDDSGIGIGKEDFVDSPDGNNNQDDVFNFNKSNMDSFSYPPSATALVSSQLQLSPRFLQSNTLLKRRSRHFSDRSSVSERSSIGSDEQLSDEDCNFLMQLNNNNTNKYQQLKSLLPPPSSESSTSISTSTKISSLYKKFATKTHVAFNKLPLLGTLEESLLKNRLPPKSEVSGFKVLLGASGNFCPTQLTIPAQTYFYEFHGQQHMATPYVCELRLSRKGYSIPHTGTVQATLLNPLGTVVRMFVVPYDFRDMPAMSQTFIRQRILAFDERNGVKNADELSTAEQMKYLRYAIHLRFQTGRSGRLCLHTDIKLLISRRTDCDTAAAHAKNSLESPNDLKIVTIVPDHPKFSSRIDK